MVRYFESRSSDTLGHNHNTVDVFKKSVYAIMMQSTEIGSDTIIYSYEQTPQMQNYLWFTVRPNSADRLILQFSKLKISSVENSDLDDNDFECGQGFRHGGGNDDVWTLEDL